MRYFWDSLFTLIYTKIKFIYIWKLLSSQKSIQARQNTTANLVPSRTFISLYVIYRSCCEHKQVNKSDKIFRIENCYWKDENLLLNIVQIDYKNTARIRISTSYKTCTIGNGSNWKVFYLVTYISSLISNSLLLNHLIEESARL